MEEGCLQCHDLNTETGKDSFFESLTKRGFALVRMRENTFSTVEKSWPLCCEMGGHVSYDPFMEFGYSGILTDTNKSFFAVKRSNPLAMMPWPTDELRDGAIALFDVLEEEARLVLSVVSSCLKVDFVGKFLGMLDDDSLAINEVSTSFMHLFNYQPVATAACRKDVCVPHTDSGLVTIIPRATSPGLQVLDWSTGAWVSTETMPDSERNVCTVLLGETMARLTCHFLQATVHRVVSSDSVRLSVPFQLRANVNASIDSIALGSPLYSVPPHFEQVVRVADFLG